MNRVDHGPCITLEEYEERIIKLHDRIILSKDDEEFIEKGELSITVDYRLGICFPYDRRDDLWDAQQRIAKRTDRLFLLILLKLVGFNKLGKIVIEEYSKVLTPDEMVDYFGDDLKLIKV